jgi:glycolate oxidase
VVPAHALLWHSEDTTPYECDGLTAYRQRPLVVACPKPTTKVQAVLRNLPPLGCRWWRAARARACRAAPCRTPWA